MTTQQDEAEDASRALAVQDGVPAVYRGIGRTDVPIELAQMMNLAEVLARSITMPRHARRPEDVVALMLAARALDVPIFQAVRGLHLVDGNIGMYADFMRALVIRAGHRFRVLHADPTRATVQIVRRDEPDEPFEVTYTIEQARTAGLAKKANWTQHPEAMLVSRATTTACRRACSDVLMGMSYSPEELGADVDFTGQVISAVSAPVSGEVQREQASRATSGRARWLSAIAEAPTVAAVTALWGEAKSAGLLDLELDGQSLRNRLHARAATIKEGEDEGEVEPQYVVVDVADVVPDATTYDTHRLKCGCDTELVFKSGEHEAGCTRTEEG